MDNYHDPKAKIGQPQSNFFSRTHTYRIVDYLLFIVVITVPTVVRICVAVSNERALIFLFNKCQHHSMRLLKKSRMHASSSIKNESHMKSICK